MTDSLEHETYIEQIGDYLAGGLSDAERTAFDLHVSTCGDCAAELKAVRALDQEFKIQLASLKPSPAFEDAIASRLNRSLSAQHRFLPIMRKGAVAAAAIAVVGGIGWAGQHYLVTANSNQFALHLGRMDKVSSALNQIDPLETGRNENKASYSRMGSAAHAFNDHDEDQRNRLDAGKRAEFQSDPFLGVQRDAVEAARLTKKDASKQSTRFSASYDANDSVLLPDDEPTAPSFKPAQQLADASEQSKGATVAALPSLPALALKDQTTPTTQPGVSGPKIIREGSIEFEVDSFDSAFVTIQKVVEEGRGFVAAVDSDKLPNGKVRGTVTLRVPPENLDTLVLKLRSLGDLKTQRLGSTDISKQYTDLEGQLRAARAMEERLLDLIKSANGKVKDLLEAENQLGTWREKIETVQGQLNFFNNRVSLATLTIIANERNVNTPASSTRHEQITAGVEMAEVEHGRAEILKSIDAAKGRVIESSLQQLEAGQLSAKIVAEVPSDATGPIADRLHQLGQVTRFDAQRSEDVGDGEATTLPLRTVQQKPTRLIISLYNVANVAPRVTTNLAMVSEDVEATYRALLQRVIDAQGRLITSNLSRNGPKSVGELRFEVRSDTADAVLNDLRAAGQVIQMTASEDADSANVTASKQGFAVTLSAADQLSPRQIRTVSVQTSDVAATQQKLLKAIETAGAKVITSTLSGNDADRSSATLITDVPLSRLDALLSVAGPNAKTTDLREDSQSPAGPLARARVTFVIANEPPLLSDHQGIWGSIRAGLITSAGGLLWSLQVLTIGLCLVAPWAGVVAGILWLVRRRRARTNKLAGTV